MRLTLVLALLVLAVPAGPAFAQDAGAGETRCWVGNVTFSAGAAINAGDGVSLCKAGTGWSEAATSTPVAGCLLEGKLSSSGAVVGVRNSDTMLLQCDPSGRWVTIETSSKP